MVFEQQSLRRKFQIQKDKNPGAVLTVGWNGYIFKQIKKPPKGVATETLRERAEKFLLNAVS